MYLIKSTSFLLALILLLSSCGQQDSSRLTEKPDSVLTPQEWQKIKPLPLDPKIEAQIDSILPKLSLEQKVGQVIQADNGSVTPEEVRKYRLGSVLSGGNSAPGALPYADAKAWVELADQYYYASIDTTGVEIAIPYIWGIDAVHGHTNLTGAIVFPHNIGLGAMHNPELIEKIAAVTAHELTVSGHDWTFAPTLAVPQDLRWGRSYEGFSEDPELVRSYAERVVYGLQGRLNQSGFMGEGQVISSAKHFLADGATEKGVDQGNALIRETELQEVHAAGYYSAIPAGVLTVMASFSSWQGRKLHGDKELLTDILKGRLGFNGFVVGDWNGHGQVPGCTNTDCAQSLNAGLDMYMAPDSWKGVYESTLQHVKEGTIPMERLDDAVRRILRVKITAGIFSKGAPSTRKNAGNEKLLGLAENRAIARQAVRESMVLLKNNKNTLPIDPAKTVLVVGDGAASISKASGGWTLSWQGTGHTNEEFPNGESILEGIEKAVNQAGGKVIYSPTADTSLVADVVIAVYGEDPYAEFQGDREHLDFVPNGFEVDKLKTYKEKDIPVVSVFLSGRPLWCNPEINLSDAFVAAWLPGSEGGGIADLLFQSEEAFDFTGSLSFAWPAKAVVEETNTPLFPLNYGLNYASSKELGLLSEDAGLESKQQVATSEYFSKGAAVAPWSLFIHMGDLNKKIASYPTSGGGLIISKTDHMAQEDAIRIKWTKEDNGQLRISNTEAINLSRQSNGAMELAFAAKAFSGSNASLQIAMCEANTNCEQTLDIPIAAGDWQEYRISLSCFEALGVDMSEIASIMMITANAGTDIGLGNVRLESDTDAQASCEGK